MNRTQEILSQQKFEKEWNVWRDAMQALPQEIRLNFRHVASQDLARHIPDGCGISTSDVNHHMFSIWKRGGQTLDGFIRECLELV